MTVFLSLPGLSGLGYHVKKKKKGIVSDELGLRG